MSRVLSQKEKDGQTSMTTQIATTGSSSSVGSVAAEKRPLSHILHNADRSHFVFVTPKGDGPLGGKELDDRKSDSKEVDARTISSPVSELFERPSLQAILKRSLMSKVDYQRLHSGPSMKGRFFATFDGYFTTEIAVNAVAVKYLQYLDNTGSLTTLTWTRIIQNLGELGALQVLFSEIFVHWIELEFYPNNKNSSNSSSSTNAAGSPGDLNTCAATIAMLPHNEATYSDLSSAFFVMRESQQSRTVNLADPFVFRGRNLERFDWKGPIGDATTAGTTMGWVALNNLATLGGRFQLATAYASGAAVGLGSLLEGGKFGILIQKVRYSLRNRF